MSRIKNNGLSALLKILIVILVIAAIVAIVAVVMSQVFKISFVDYFKDCVWPGLKQMFTKPVEVVEEIVAAA